MIFKFLQGKRPRSIPELAVAVERLAQARQMHAKAVADLTAAEGELGQQLLDVTDTTKARATLAAAEAKAK